MINVRFILINKLAVLLLILIFYGTILTLNKFFKKNLPLSGVIGTIKLCILGLLLLFFESQLTNIFFYGTLIKKFQEIITLVCFANTVTYIVLEFLLYYRMKKDVPTIVRDVVRLGIFIFFGMVSLKIIFNIEVSSIITTSAVLTAAVAFAMQNTLSNIISGFAVQIDKNLKKHTWITLKDKNLTGKVENVNFRYTELRTLENEKIIVPNNYLLQNIIISYGTSKENDPSALTLSFGVAYDVPPLKVKKIVHNILSSHRDVLQSPEPAVFIANFGENSMEVKMRFFIADYERRDKIRDEILTRCWYSLTREGYEIPYPHREILIRKPSKPFELNIAEAKSLLQKVDMFNFFREEELEDIIRKSHYKVFSNGEIVVKQGEDGDSLFFVFKGELEVFIDNRKVATLIEGEIFGEMSLLTGEKRKATVISITESHLLEITKNSIAPFLKNEAFINAIANLITERELKNTNFMTSEEGREFLNKKENFLSKLKNFFGLK